MTLLLVRQTKSVKTNGVGLVVLKHTIALKNVPRVMVLQQKQPVFHCECVLSQCRCTLFWKYPAYCEEPNSVL